MILLLGWINLTTYIGAFNLFGSIAMIASGLAATLLTVVVVYIPVLVGFGLFFGFSLENHPRFDNLFEAIFMTFPMAIGELEYVEMIAETKGLHKLVVDSIEKIFAHSWNHLWQASPRCFH